MIKIKEWRIPLWWLVNVVTPPLCGIPPSVWYPIIPCLELHLCLLPHPLSGTPPHVWNPIPCLEPHHPMSGTPPVSSTTSTVWNPNPCLEPHPLSDIPPPVPPSHHLGPSTPTPIWSLLPLSDPWLPLTTWSGPRLPPPSGIPTSCLHPHPIKYHQRSPQPERKFGLFQVFWCSFQSHLTSISPCIVISFTTHPKIPKIVVQQPRFCQWGTSMSHQKWHCWMFTVVGKWRHGSILCTQIPTNDCSLK